MSILLLTLQSYEFYKKSIIGKLVIVCGYFGLLMKRFKNRPFHRHLVFRQSCDFSFICEPQTIIFY